MAKFKVGDIVRAVTNEYGYTNKCNEWEGVVIGVGDVCFSAKTTHVNNSNIRFAQIYKGLEYEDFELIKSVAKDPVLRVDGIITDLINDNKSLFDKVEFRYEIKSKKPILDDIEKRYLSDVIRPFRDKVKYIKKESREFDSYEYICIILNEDNLGFLPYFEKDTMYKGMKPGKRYTLKELGL